MNHKSAAFIKLNRSREALELMQDPNAFSLLSLIAWRAKRTGDFSIHNLQPGEALIGDYKACGQTERQYRTAKSRLEQWGLATFKPTNKGTIARLTNTRIYDINQEASDEQNDRPTTDQATGQRRTNDEPDDRPETTIKKLKEVKNEKKKTFSSDSIEIGLVEFFVDLLDKRAYPWPGGQKADPQKWAVGFDKLIRIDKRTPGDIRAVLEWAQADIRIPENGSDWTGWADVILSPEALRKRWGKAWMKMTSRGRKRKVGQRPLLKVTCGCGEIIEMYRQGEPCPRCKKPYFSTTLEAAR